MTINYLLLLTTVLAKFHLSFPRLLVFAVFCLWPGICPVDFGQSSFSGFDPECYLQGQAYVTSFLGLISPEKPPLLTPPTLQSQGSAWDQPAWLEPNWPRYPLCIVCVCVLECREGGEVWQGVEMGRECAEDSTIDNVPFIQRMASWNALQTLDFPGIIFLFTHVCVQ